MDITELDPGANFDDPDAPDTDDDEITDDSDDIYQALMELQEAGIELVEEDRPVVSKRTPKEPETPWESYLRMLVQYPGKTVRLFEYSGEDARAKARRRGTTIRNRLIKTNPEELWLVTWDFVKSDESWRVYVSYERDRTETELTELAEKQEKARERGRHAAATRAKK